MKKLLLVLTLLPCLLFAQNKKQRKALEAQRKADQQVILNLKTHIEALSSDAGSKDGAAINYITTQFKSAGLHPFFKEDFVQAFEVKTGRQVDRLTYLKVNDKTLELNKDYFPLSYSASKKVTGMPAMDLHERNVPWFTDLKNLVEEKNYDINNVIRKEASKAILKGATALFVYNSSDAADTIKFSIKDEPSPVSIPVVYITAAGLNTYFKDHSEILDIDLNVAFSDVKKTGHNIAGILDNKASETVVVLSQYSVGDTDPSLLKGMKPLQSATNTATLIELAKTISTAKSKAHNYIFALVQTNGAELNGIKAFIYDLPGTAANYVINLESLLISDTAKGLVISDYLSASSLKDVLNIIPKPLITVTAKDKITPTQTSAAFFNRGIPVITFSSADDGFSADINNINYVSQLSVLKYVSAFIEAADLKGKQEFVKSAIPQQPGEQISKAFASSQVSTVVPGTLNKGTVSLGIIADPGASSEGLRIKGTTPQKVASKIGLIAGDVLISLGDYPIKDFKSYLSALSHFKSGDKTTLLIKRNNIDKTFEIAF